MEMKKLILTFIVFLMAVQNVWADSTVFVSRWYEALRTVNRPTFERLLSDKATIDLRELGVIQNKEEFIESLDYWEDVAGDLLISTNIVSSTDTKIVVDVCYRFPSEPFTNRETFYLGSGLIERQEQEKIRDDC
ncbi:MAG: nuclear transport factor 2 family protein [Pseudomonadota bacterium]